MSEMVERVARALHEAAGKNNQDALVDEFQLERLDDDLKPVGRSTMLDGCFDLETLARAAIEAMKEPTENMRRSGWAKLREKNDFQSRLGNSLVGVETPIYEAMIDAALDQ